MSQEKTLESFDVDDQDEVFEEIMKHVGRKGFFQKRFNIVFNLFFVMLMSMPCMNPVLLMAVPDHWCYVPGREVTNYTLEEWKNLTLPRKSTEDKTFSSCEMFNITEKLNEVILRSRRSDEPNSDANNPVKCQHGWEYDTTWYTSTAPSEGDWVCENELKVTNVFSVSRFAEVIGTFCFGQLGDTMGRRPVFFVALIFLVVGRIMLVFVADHYFWFLVASVIGSVAVSPGFQSPLVISMEVSASDTRANIAMWQCLGWTAGICLMPMVAWVTRGWVLFVLVSTIPCAFFLLLYRQFPESPRWLAAKGKPVQCLKVLKYISKVNGTKLPDDTIIALQKLAERREKTYGLASLFTSWRLAKNTILICISWIVNTLAYYVLVLNVTNMAGNPFMNFFWQSLVELPGYILGRMFSDRYGRRWSESGGMFSMPVICIALMFTVQDPNLQVVTLVLVVILKLCNTVAFYVIYLQALEIYPTPLRQTGTSFGSLIANLLGILGPYIVFLGTAYDIRYPYAILGVLAIFGGIATTFLPETLHQKLPETLADAHHFGEDQPYWKFNYQPVKQKDECDDKMNAKD